MITKNTSLFEISKDPKKAEILIKYGLHCVGCMAARFETLEQGLKAHGFDSEKINEVIDKLNNN